MTALQICKAALEEIYGLAQQQLDDRIRGVMFGQIARAALEAAAKVGDDDAGYLGHGHPWGDFLHYRAILLDSWARDGKSPEMSARDLSMDPAQVALILDAYQRGAG